MSLTNKHVVFTVSYLFQNLSNVSTWLFVFKKFQISFTSNFKSIQRIFLTFWGIDYDVQLPNNSTLIPKLFSRNFSNATNLRDQLFYTSYFADAKIGPKNSYNKITCPRLLNHLISDTTESRSNISQSFGPYSCTAEQVDTGFWICLTEKKIVMFN